MNRWGRVRSRPWGKACPYDAPDACTAPSCDQPRGASRPVPSARARPTEECRMQLGMIGLGRMGANIVRRLMRGGHECVVYDRNPDSVRALESEGAIGAGSTAELAAKLTGPR